MHIEVIVDYTPLLKRMDEKNYTDYKMKKYGIHHKTFYNIRQGKIITIETLAKIAFVLECEINDLVKFEYKIID